MTAAGSRRLVGALVLALTFAAGLLAGRALPWAPRQIVRRTRVALQPSAMFAGLDLTPGQRRVIDSLVAAEQPRVDSLTRHVLPQLRAVAESLDARVRAVLTPAQRARLDSLRSTAAR